MPTFSSPRHKKTPKAHDKKLREKLLNFVHNINILLGFHFSFFNEIGEQKMKTPNKETRKKVIKRNNKK